MMDPDEEQDINEELDTNPVPKLRERPVFAPILPTTFTTPIPVSDTEPTEGTEAVSEAKKAEKERDSGVLEMLTGESERERLIPKETPAEMMADVTGVPEGEGGMDEMIGDVTGMGEGDTEEKESIDDITGMGPGAWEQITGMPSKPKIKPKIVSRRTYRSPRRTSPPGIGTTGGY